MDDARWLAEVVRLAEENVAAGGGPFAALVVRDDELVAVGANQVTSTLDPTAHAEVVAIRQACVALEDFRLTGCVLVSSCEPCPLCLSASLWARLDGVLYAADREDAAHAGFDDRRFYDVFASPRESWPVAVRQERTGGELAPFSAWLNRSDRVEY